jgi:WG containing repeat
MMEMPIIKYISLAFSMIHFYWIKQKCKKKIVFLLAGLSCLSLQACFDEDYRYTCTITLLPFQTQLPFNPHCIGNPSEGMSLINDGGTYMTRDFWLVDNGKWGYANLNNEIVVHPQYDSARDFVEGLASVGVNGRSGFIDKTGKVVIPLQFSETFSFSERLAAAKLNGKWGYLDKTGKVVIPFQFTEALSFSEGLVAVKLNGKWRYIDKTGRFVFSYNYGTFGFVSPPAFVKGFIAAELSGKLGFIDKTGKVVIPFKFDTRGYRVPPAFVGGLAELKLNGKWGYIDKSGQVIIPFKYDYSHRYDNGTIQVYIGGKSEVFDRTGKPISK